MAARPTPQDKAAPEAPALDFQAFKSELVGILARAAARSHHAKIKAEPSLAAD